MKTVWATFVPLSPWRPGFVTKSVYVEFVMDKLALEQVIVQVLRVSSVNAIKQWLSMLIGDRQWAH
jgi:hypothetical protein